MSGDISGVAAGRNGLAAIKQAKEDQKRQRRGFAKQRAEMLRAELDGLRRHGRANPKGAARRAAQIARELSSAVREYVRGKPAEAPRPAAPLGPSLSPGPSLGEDRVGADQRFAAKIRRAVAQARAVVERQRREGRDDREYARLSRQAAASGVAVEGALMGAAPAAASLDIRV